MWTLTTQDDWSYLINRQSIEIYDEIADIIDPVNRYNYTMKYKNVMFQGNQTTNNNFEFEMEETTRIDYNNTTYILVYMAPAIVSYEQTAYTNALGCSGYGLDIKPMWAPQARPQGYKNYIRGTYIIAEGGTIEVVDVGSLLFQILSMPFTFMSVAFDLTIFPGTPYQINFSNLFLTLIAVMIFIFILKLLLAVAKGSQG